MNRDRNETTQPLVPRTVFNRWDVLAKGWYAVCRSDELPRGGVRGVDVGRQHLAIWRGADGRLRAVDGFCPHMGTDLAIGRVHGDTLTCFFHHWRFDGQGACVHVPAGAPPTAARLHAYDVRERFGLVWVWPEAVAPHDVPGFEGLERSQERIWHGRPIQRTCHHHVCMINGIDVQHLATVHGIDMAMSVHLAEDPTRGLLDITLRGPPPSRSLVGRVLRRALGNYGYAMRYGHGTVGLLTTVHQTVAFERWRLPEARMVFAYTPRPGGGITIRPVFVAEARPGPLGRLRATLQLAAMWLGFHVLRDEDGRVYDNIRFHTRALLPVDAPVARFVAWVDRLEPSAWTPAASPEPGEHGLTQDPTDREAGRSRG